MEEMSLTHEELIRTFKRCSGGSANACQKCAYKTTQTRCKMKKLHTDVIALIQHLQSENERLKNHIQAKEIADKHVREMRGTDLRTIAEQKEEIERYQCVNKLLEGDIEALNKALEKRVEDVYADFMQDYKIMCDELNGLYEENSHLDGCAKQSLADYQKCEIENAELRKQVDELTEELATYICKAVFYYNKCKEYGVENFHDEMLEEQFKGKEGNTIQFPKFKGEVE